MFAEAFPARVRYSGASIAYALGSIMAAPSPDRHLAADHHRHHPVRFGLLALFTVFAPVAVTLLKSRDGRPLARPTTDCMRPMPPPGPDPERSPEPAAAGRR